MNMYYCIDVAHRGAQFTPTFNCGLLCVCLLANFEIQNENGLKTRIKISVTPEGTLNLYCACTPHHAEKNRKLQNDRKSH